MQRFKRITFLSLVCFLFLVACQHDEAVTPQGDIVSEFSPGKLASVQIAKDYEVNFWEIEPGNIMVDVYSSVDAQMNSSIDVKNIIRGNDYVKMYKLLAGKNLDPLSIKNMEAAQSRMKNLPLSATSMNNAGFFLKTSDDDATALGARTAKPACSRDRDNDFYSRQMFIDNYFTPKQPISSPDWQFLSLNLGSLFYPNLTTAANTKWIITVMNGDYSSDNVVRVQHTGSFDATIKARKVRTFTIKPSRSGAFNGTFTNGLTCGSIHFYFINDQF